MCGITFIVDKQQRPVAPDLIEKANRALQHRGPDEQNSFFWNNLALGFTRLSIVDIAGGSQPFFNEDQSIVLVCNGEIYNYRELRQQLIGKGHTFHSQSDCEVIIHAYEDDPAGFINQLNGMFAFVLLDLKNRRALLARDRLGIKPLFIADGPDYFVCSSEIKGLLAAKLVSPQFNRQGLYDFFVFNYIPGNQTAFEGIEHLPPSTLLTLDLQTSLSSSREYWKPEFPEARPHKLYKTRIYADHLREVFREAVATHTIGDLPVASYLSGGIDSTITSIVLQSLRSDAGPLNTFSIRFADRAYDESEIFLKTAEEYKFKAQICDLQSIDASLFGDVIHAIEQPQITPMDVPMYCLSNLVRQNNTKVVLSGEGSDELFGGYFQFTLNQIRRALSLPMVSRFKAPLLNRVLRYYFRSPEDRAFYAQPYLSDPAEVIGRYGTYPVWYPAWLAKSKLREGLFKAPLADSLGEGSAFYRAAQPLKNEYSRIDDFDKSIYLEQKLRLPNYILSRADRNSMAHSVELRVPFLSNRMIDVSAAIPPILKMLGLREKFILRKAFENTVPPRVLARMKFGYSAPASLLWNHEDAQRDELLSDDALQASDIFDPAVVHQLQEDRRQSPDLRRREDSAALLTGVLSTQLLHQRFIQQ